MATRRERVILTLQDDFTSKMARAAAATALLKRELDDLSGSASQSSTGVDRAERSTERLGRTSSRAGRDIDGMGNLLNRSSGRIVLFAEAAASLGPALVPIAGLAIPAITGLASSMGFAAVAGGTMIGAFQGVGGALTAMNKAALEPTAENIAAARTAMEDITPAAQDFVTQIRDMGPAFREMRDAGATAMFPGFTAGLEALESRLPDVERIMAAVGGALGDIGEAGGESLASGRWDEFFTFLEQNAPQALKEMADGVGNLTHGLAEMWMAFDPINDDFSQWLVKVTDDFDKWAAGLSDTQGFAEFMDYLSTTGPQVGATLGAIADALVQIVQAAAPIAGPILSGLEAFADVIGAIADSDLGTPIFGMVAALAAANLSIRAFAAVQRSAFQGPAINAIQRQRTALQGLRADYAAYASTNRGAMMGPQTLQQSNAAIAASQKLGTTLRSTAVAAGKAGALIGGLAILTTDAGQSMGVTNTASLALAGSMFGGLGAGIGAAVGAMLDLQASTEGAREAITATNAAIKTGDIDAMTAAYKRLNAERAKNEVAPKNRTTDGPFDFAGMADQAQAAYADLTGVTAKIEAAQARIRGAMGGKVAFNVGGNLAGLDSDTANLERFGRTLRGLDNDMLSTADSASKLSNALNALIGPGLSAEEATDQYRVAMQGLNKELKSGAGFEGFTKGAVANREATRGVVADLTNMITKQAEAGASASKIGRAVENARGAFIREGVAAGFSAKEMRKRANALGLTPKLVRTVMQVVNAKSVENMTKQLRAIPKTKLTRILAEGIPKSEAGMRKLKRQYDLTPKQVKTLASLRDQATPIQRRILRALGILDGREANPKANLRDGVSPAVASARRALQGLDGDTATTYIRTVRIATMRPSGGSRDEFATGGFTGYGGKYEPAGVVHRSEFVFSKEATQGNVAMLEDLHRRLRRGYADGGYVEAANRQARRYASSGPVSVASPNVSVGGPSVRVFIDGSEVRAIVDDRISAHQDIAGQRGRI